MSATTFDTLKAARDLENAGVERRQAEAIAKAMRDAAGADRGEFVTRGELCRALWIQGVGYRRHPHRAALPSDPTFTGQGLRVPAATTET